jgi:hypothetical protein
VQPPRNAVLVALTELVAPFAIAEALMPFTSALA